MLNWNWSTWFCMTSSNENCFLFLMKVFKCVDKLCLYLNLAQTWSHLGFQYFIGIYQWFFVTNFCTLVTFKKFNENIFSQIPCFLENDFQPFEKFSWGTSSLSFNWDFISFGTIKLSVKVRKSRHLNPMFVYCIYKCFRASCI